MDVYITPPLRSLTREDPKKIVSAEFIRGCLPLSLTVVFAPLNPFSYKTTWFWGMVVAITKLNTKFRDIFHRRIFQPGLDPMLEKLSPQAKVFTYTVVAVTLVSLGCEMTLNSFLSYAALVYLEGKGSGLRVPIA